MSLQGVLPACCCQDAHLWPLCACMFVVRMLALVDAKMGLCRLPELCNAMRCGEQRPEYQLFIRTLTRLFQFQGDHVQHNTCSIQTAWQLACIAPAGQPSRHWSNRYVVCGMMHARQACHEVHLFIRLMQFQGRHTFHKKHAVQYKQGLQVRNASGCICQEPIRNAAPSIHVGSNPAHAPHLA